MTAALKLKKDSKPANQFNYSERASQTYNNPLRVRSATRRLNEQKVLSGVVIRIAWFKPSRLRDTISPPMPTNGRYTTPTWRTWPKMRWVNYIINSVSLFLWNKLEAFQKAKAAAAGKSSAAKSKDEHKSKLSAIADKDTDDLKLTMTQPLKILERMVNQNTFDEISEGSQCT